MWFLSYGLCQIRSIVTAYARLPWTLFVGLDNDYHPTCAWKAVGLLLCGPNTQSYTKTPPGCALLFHMPGNLSLIYKYM